MQVITQKEYLQGRVDKRDYKEFVVNSFQEHGPKNGFKGKRLSSAIKMYNAYFKPMNGYKLIQIAREMGFKPWELSHKIIEKVLVFYQLSQNEGIKLKLDEITEETLKEMVMVLKNNKENYLFLILPFLYKHSTLLRFDECLTLSFCLF